MILGGDLNAMIGVARPGEEATIGPHGVGRRNARGTWLASWADLQHLAFTSSFFSAPAGNIWSYTKAGVRRLIDYILVSRMLMVKVVAAGVEDSIGVGSDHRTSGTFFIFDNTPAENRRKAKHAYVGKAWAPKDDEAFKLETTSRLRQAITVAPSAWSTKDAEDKCKAIEKTHP